jgi:AcrR family transcriptional regulator
MEAAAMFATEGVKSVRMDDIAARLVVSKRTLYEMFSDKSDLLEQSLGWYFEQKRLEMLRNIETGANVIEQIFLALDTIKRDEKDTTLINNIKKFYPEIYARLEAEAHEFSHAEFDKLLNRGMAEGLFLPDMNKGLALMTVASTMTALMERRYVHFPQDGVSARMAFEYVLVNFFRGLSTHKGIEMIDELVKNYRNKNNTQI